MTTRYFLALVNNYIQLSNTYFYEENKLNFLQKMAGSLIPFAGKNVPTNAQEK